MTGARVLRRLLARGPAPQPPVHGPRADVARLDAAPRDDTFITGNGIARRCGWVRNYGEPRRNEDGRPDWWFCKTDFVDWFFAHEAPRRDFVLFSHNSDIAVDASFARHLRNRKLRAWYAANVAYEHPKLRAVPLGIAGPSWPHGDADALRRVQLRAPEKSTLVDVSFSVGTNPLERRYCIEQTGLEPAPARPYEVYLEALASAWFALCPRGHGIDTHRTWEALYLRTIPVVTRSILSDQHPDLPLVVLDDWSAFRSLELSPELYERMWRDWDPESLRLDRYLALVTRS